MVLYTTTDLISQIKLVAHVPQGNATFGPDEFLQLADMEMRTGVAPRIASCREQYWLTTTPEMAVNDSNAYPIPSRSQGNGIVDVKIKTGSNLIHLLRVEPSELYSTQYADKASYCYYLEDNNVRLIPPNVPGSVIMWYYRIPSELVATTACAQITDISGNSVTVDQVPSTFVSQELDIVSQQPGFTVLLKDTTPASIVGQVISFGDDISTQIQVGDWVCLAGQSCVVQCPLEWIAVLVQRVAVRIYEIQGYSSKQVIAEKTLAKMEQNALGLVSPRTIESAKVIGGGGSLLNPINMGWKLPVR